MVGVHPERSEGSQGLFAGPSLALRATKREASGRQKRKSLRVTKKEPLRSPFATLRASAQGNKKRGPSLRSGRPPTPGALRA